jgi:hypothetical protein
MAARAAPSSVPKYARIEIGLEEVSARCPVAAAASPAIH